VTRRLESRGFPARVRHHIERARRGGRLSSGLRSQIAISDARGRTGSVASRERQQPRSQPPWAGQLIWPSFCQVGSTKGPRLRAFLLVERGGGPGGCATRGQADIRGLATAGPGFVFRARRLATGVTDRGRLPIGVSRMLWREGARRRRPARPTFVARVSRRWRPPSRSRRARALRRQR
jgi:hypothetical protein